MRHKRTFERTALAILFVVSLYLTYLNHQLRSQVRHNATVTPTSGLESSLSEVAAISGSPVAKPSTNDEHSELLRLRGQVAQLSRELSSRGSVSPPISKLAAHSSTNLPSDTELFTAAITNSVPPGQSLIIGGWSAGGLRTYLVINLDASTPAPAGQQQFSMKGHVLRAPDSVWTALGWGDAASETRQSKLAGTLGSSEVDALLAALKQNKDSTISSTKQADVTSGGHIGYGFSVEDEDGVGVLMSVEVYPRNVPGTQLVEVGVTPSPPSNKVSVHNSLKRAAL